MIIGSISENKNIEKRISLVPEIIKKYISNGFEVILEEGIGSHIGFDDNMFKELGCKLDKKENVLKNADILLQVNFPEESNFNKFKQNNILIGNFNSTQNIENIKKLDLNKTSVFSMELLPRITRAQSMDILSSQANLAGYKAVVDSFSKFSRAIPNDDDSGWHNISSKSISSWCWSCGFASNSYSKKNGSNCLCYRR